MTRFRRGEAGVPVPVAARTDSAPDSEQEESEEDETNDVKAVASGEDRAEDLVEDRGEDRDDGEAAAADPGTQPAHAGRRDRWGDAESGGGKADGGWPTADGWPNAASGGQQREGNVWRLLGWMLLAGFCILSSAAMLKDQGVMNRRLDAYRADIDGTVSALRERIGVQHGEIVQLRNAHGALATRVHLQTEVLAGVVPDLRRHGDALEAATRSSIDRFSALESAARTHSERFAPLDATARLAAAIEVAVRELDGRMGAVESTMARVATAELGANAAVLERLRRLEEPAASAQTEMPQNDPPPAGAAVLQPEAPPVAEKARGNGSPRRPRARPRATV